MADDSQSQRRHGCGKLSQGLRRALLALAMGFAALPAWGWGGTGHRMICEIAWQQLTPAARGEVQDADAPRTRLASLQ